MSETPPDFQIWISGLLDDERDEIAKVLIEALDRIGIDYTFQGRNVVV